MWIFEHNFVADKAKIRRRAVARQVFFTQYAAKFAEKTRVSACEDWFLHFGENSGNYSDSITTNFYSCLIAATEYNSNQSSGIFHRQFISVIIPYTDFQNLQVRQLFCNPKSTTRLICGIALNFSTYCGIIALKQRNELKQKAVAKECANWMRRKVCFKTNTTREGMNHFLLVDGDEDTDTYMPMNTLL